MTIPRALFDDLEKLDHELLAKATCACFVSVDARLPTALARIHLEYRQRRRFASKIDLRRFIGAHSTWLSSVLPRERDRLRLINFPGELPVFLAASTPRDEYPDRLETLTRDLSFMLSLEERINLENRARRIRFFRLAVKVLEARAAQTRAQSPIGRWANIETFSPESRAYMSGRAQPCVPFYQYKLMLTSQLRVLSELAQAFAKIDGAELDRMDDADRDYVIDKLERLILQGMTVPVQARTSDDVREFLADVELRDEPEGKLFDGVEAWLLWLSPTRRQRPEHKDFWLSVLAQLPSGYDDTVWTLLHELADSDLEVVRALADARASHPQDLSI